MPYSQGNIRMFCRNSDGTEVTATVFFKTQNGNMEQIVVTNGSSTLVPKVILRKGDLSQSFDITPLLGRTITKEEINLFGVIRITEFNSLEMSCG
jgi:hypothetical protein